MKSVREDLFRMERSITKACIPDFPPPPLEGIYASLEVRRTVTDKVFEAIMRPKRMVVNHIKREVTHAD